MPYKISVVMPALNEEENIVAAVENAAQAFTKVGVTGEIVVVDDGSRDRTGELVRNLQKQYSFLRMIRHESPMGIGRSFWDGALQATGEIVTLLPGDAENDGYEIMRYLPLMNEVDLVVPYVFNRSTRSPFRRFVSKLYRSIINGTFNTTLNYMNGTVMYRRTILQQLTLKSNGFFYQTELLMKCLRAGYLYAEVPYGLKQRAAGASTALTLKSFYRVAKDYFIVIRAVNFSQGVPTSLVKESISYARTQSFLALPPGTAPDAAIEKSPAV